MDQLLASQLRVTLPHLSLASVSLADGEALADIRVAAMRESLEAVGHFDPQRARRRFLDNFDPACTWSLLWQGERVGFTVVRKLADHIHLNHLYLLPQAQGHGIGADVLRALFAVADGAGLPVRVAALTQSRSNAFYQRNGFRLVDTAEWDNYYVRAPGS